MELTIKTTIQRPDGQEVMIISGNSPTASLRSIRQELERQQGEITKKYLETQLQTK